MKKKTMTAKKQLLMASVLLCLAFGANAQEVKSEETKKDTAKTEIVGTDDGNSEVRKPEGVIKEEVKRGEAIIQVFANFHSGFGEQANDRGFELDRAYIGYQYDLGKGLSIKGVMDIGAKTDGYDRVVYLKNAQVSWEKVGWTLSCGLISTTIFNTAEKHWGYRYMYKSFQDHYKFGSSADLGVSVAYKPARWVSMDAIVVNGEGYKKLQVDNRLMYGLGVQFVPVDGLTLRAYAQIDEQPERKMQINYSAFGGYNHKWFSLGAEYCYMQRTKGVIGHDKSGVSVYATGRFCRWAEMMARYDELFSKQGWAVADEERVFLVGAQFMPCKYVKLTPNFRIVMPKDGDKIEYSAYVNCYFGI